MRQVEADTVKELEQLGIEPTAPGLAAVARRLAKTLDNVPLKSPTSAAIVARELRVTMLELRKAAPAPEEGDGIDDLARKRAERLSAGAASRGAAGGDT